MRWEITLLCVAVLVSFEGIFMVYGGTTSSDRGIEPIRSVEISAAQKTGSVSERFKLALDSEWKKVDPNRVDRPSTGKPDEPPSVFWDYRLSPPFPSAWPPKTSRPLSYYAYAYGMDFQISDGERLAMPWARLDILPGSKGSARLHILVEKIENTFIHGIRPLTEEESAVYRLGPKVESFLASLNALPDEAAAETEELRKFYCAWLADGGIADGIRPYYEEFFQWLRCEQTLKNPASVFRISERGRS